MLVLRVCDMWPLGQFPFLVPLIREYTIRKVIRDGGKMTMTADQINATCGEARKVGLRAVVHAHASDGARAAIMAGCTSIEHGTFLADATLELMAARGVYFDPNFLVLHNYLDNKESSWGARIARRRGGSRKIVPWA